MASSLLESRFHILEKKNIQDFSFWENYRPLHKLVAASWLGVMLFSFNFSGCMCSWNEHYRALCCALGATQNGSHRTFVSILRSAPQDQILPSTLLPPSRPSVLERKAHFLLPLSRDKKLHGRTWCFSPQPRLPWAGVSRTRQVVRIMTKQGLAAGCASPRVFSLVPWGDWVSFFSGRTMFPKYPLKRAARTYCWNLQAPTLDSVSMELYRWDVGGAFWYSWVCCRGKKRKYYSPYMHPAVVYSVFISSD